MSSRLPSTMKAIVIASTEETPTIKDVPTPEPTYGSAVVKVLVAHNISYIRDVYNGKRKYPFPVPLVGGTSAIGRIAAVGPDSTTLEQGDLVLVDCFIRSRDSARDVFLAGIYEGDSVGSAKLMRDVWRDYTYAEYCRVPLENTFRLNEGALIGKGGLGYSFEQLAFASTLAVPYGGLKDINLQAGETVVIAPATGPFGGAAVLVALAMGATVIAMGRNKASLAALKGNIPDTERVKIVQIVGDVSAEVAALKQAARGEADAFLDIGPPEAVGSSHVKSAILSLRHSGRASLMSGYPGDVPLPYRQIMHKSIRLHGKWMYEPSDIRDLIKMLEGNVLDLSVCRAKRFPLEDFEEAWNVAAEEAAFARYTVLVP